MDLLVNKQLTFVYFSQVQELAKLHYRTNLWTCGICGKSFYREPYLDLHMAKLHSDLTSKVHFVTIVTPRDKLQNEVCDHL